MEASDIRRLRKIRRLEENVMLHSFAVDRALIENRCWTTSAKAVVVTIAELLFERGSVNLFPIQLLLYDDTASRSDSCAGIDCVALAHLTVEDDRAGSLVPDLDAEPVDSTSARELSVNDG